MSQPRSAPRHASRVAASLEALKTGQVESKRDACKMAGIGTSALAPARLAPLASKAPELSHLSRFRGSMLDMVVDYEGKPITLRETLAGCAESAARALQDVGRRAHNDLTPAEAKKISRAKMLLDLCKTSNLWDDNGPDMGTLAIQAEMRQREITALSVDSLLRDHHRQDGISPTLRKLHALPEATSDSNSSAPSASGDSED